MLPYSRLQLRLNIAHCVTVRQELSMGGASRKWHGAWNTQESGAMQTLCVSFIVAEHSFRDNLHNTQCSNATAIDQ